MVAIVFRALAEVRNHSRKFGSHIEQQLGAIRGTAYQQLKLDYSHYTL